jgi:Mrp family chromosome partitioning ATPase
VLRRRAWIFIACVVTIPAVAYVAVALQPPKYRARTIVQSQELAPRSLVVLPGLPSGWFVDPGPNFLAVLTQTADVRLAAAKQARTHPADFGRVDTHEDKKTDWLTISVTADTRRDAIAQTRALIDAIASNVHVRVRRAIADLQSGLPALMQSAKTQAERRAVAAQAARFREFRPADQQPLQVIEPVVGAQTVSNGPGRAALVAFVLALLLGVRAVRLAERADSRIHDVFQLEELAGLPAMAVVPRRHGQSPEPFLRLRDALVHLSDQGAGSTIVVTSPMGGDGRTTAAEGLARAYSTLGLAVVLVEADLRRPRLADRFSVPAAPGLADVLAGGDVSAALHVPAGGGSASLTVLPAGDVERGARDLGSPRMDAVMQELSQRADVVVVDTPALLETSDALAMAEHSSAVVVCARIEHTRGRALQRALRVLERAGADVAGLVVLDGDPLASSERPNAVTRPLEAVAHGLRR